MQSFTMIFTFLIYIHFSEVTNCCWNFRVPACLCLQSKSTIWRVPKQLLAMHIIRRPQQVQSWHLLKKSTASVSTTRWQSLSLTTSARVKVPGRTLLAGVLAWQAMRPTRSPKPAMPVLLGDLSTIQAKALALFALLIVR